MALTAKQAAFVNEYLIDLNATQAAIRAGYSKDTARAIGHENLTKPDIARVITAALAERSERTQVTQDYVIGSIIQTMERCKQDKDFNPAAILNGAKLLGEHLGVFKSRVELTGKDGAPIETRQALPEWLLQRLKQTGDTKPSEASSDSTPT